jgi:hypothetical protein
MIQAESQQNKVASLAQQAFRPSISQPDYRASIPKDVLVQVEKKARRHQKKLDEASKSEPAVAAMMMGDEGSPIAFIPGVMQAPMMPVAAPRHKVSTQKAWSPVPAYIPNSIPKSPSMPRKHVMMESSMGRWMIPSTPGYRTISVFIPTSTSDPKLFQPHYPDMVKQALNQWTEASEGLLRFTYTDTPRKADIRINWVEKCTGQTGCVGFTRSQMDGNRNITRATVDVQTWGIFDKQEPAMPGMLRVTILHELGHAIGLDHTHSPADVMDSGENVIRSWSEWRAYEPMLSEGDRQALYGIYATSWPTGDSLATATKGQKRSKSL